MVTRTEKLRSLCGTGFGLEIGPSHNPIFPKRDGFQVHNLDHVDAEKLRHKYRNADVDLSRIEDVDFVTSGRSITEVVPYRSFYDFIFASHVIEHVPDIIKFIRNCGDLLKPTGALVLAVPDKRYCFDLFRPISTAGHAIEAHSSGRNRPSKQMIFDEIFYAATRDGKIGWLPTNSGGDIGFFRPSIKMADSFEGANASDDIDVHCWQFTPSSFRLMMLDLKLVGMIDFIVSSFQDSGGEFFVSMTSSGSINDVDARLELARSMMSEVASLAQIAAPPAQSSS